MAKSKGQSSPPLETIIDGITRVKRGIYGLQKKLQNKWDDTSISVKILVWLPFQGILFKIQPQLWKVIAYIADIFVNMSTFIAGGVITLHFQSQLILVIFAAIVVQTTFVTLRLLKIERELESVNTQIEEVQWIAEDIEWTVDDIRDEIGWVTDGGRPMNPDNNQGEEDTTGTGALGGAIAGGALGASMGGPAGAIGGAFLGLILGDEFEKGQVNRQKKKHIKNKVVELLLKQRIVHPDYKTIQYIEDSLFDVDQQDLEVVLTELAQDEEAPVIFREERQYPMEDHAQISLRDLEEARRYLRNRRE